MDFNTTKPILVTGASGYIAAHIIQRLLKRGYKVRGTVRSLAKKEKYSFLTQLAPEKSTNLEFIEADLTNEESWTNAVKGVDYVLHVASPIPPYVPKDKNEIIIPAVNGTKFVLNASLKAGVKKVVITSSCLAIWFGNQEKVIDESMWSDTNKCSHYPKSKTLAEKAAWEFYEQHKSKIEVTVVNPSMVLGPPLSKHGNSSEALVANMLDGSYPGILDVTVGVADVRDAAEGHIQALLNPKVNGRRYIVSGHQLHIKDLAQTLSNNFSKYGYKINLQDITPEEAKASGNGAIARMIPLHGKAMKFTNERSLKELGMKYTPIKDTIIDMVPALIKAGTVENKIK